MGFFGAARVCVCVCVCVCVWVGGCVCVCVCVCMCVCGGGLSRSHLPTICHTYPTMMKLGSYNSFNFFESLKKILIKVLILMMSAIMATQGLLKIKVF